LVHQLTRLAAAEWLRQFAGRRIAVVGDLFLDEYLVGQPERLSREAPVPVLLFRRRFCLPGGSANPSRNIAALSAAAQAIGVTGADAAAEELQQALVAAASLGRALDSEADFQAATGDLRAALGARAVILGRGSAGMSVADESGYAVVPPVNVSEVYDVSGAGDTVIAVVTLALVAGAPFR
jgi:bifunctional ADP-heptose synthase (sugar kinase/adenylyltransferase)